MKWNKKTRNNKTKIIKNQLNCNNPGKQENKDIKGSTRRKFSLRGELISLDMIGFKMNMPAELHNCYLVSNAIGDKNIVPMFESCYRDHVHYIQLLLFSLRHL